MLKHLENTGKQSAISKSTIKQFRNFFLDNILIDETEAQNLWPKKGKVQAIKLKTPDQRKYQHLIVEKEMHFANVDGIIVPDLRTVHKYPNLYPKFQVDQGAIKFMLKGANVMAPGLINEHGYMDEVQEQKIVAIYVHGYEHAIVIKIMTKGLGMTKKSTEQIRTQKEGVVVEMVHFVGDGFWSLLLKE